MRLDATLGEESQCFANVGVVPHSEDLNLHVRTSTFSLQRMTRASTPECKTSAVLAGACVSVPRRAWWLPGSHLQTIFAKLFRGIPMPPATRETWKMSDGDMASIERVRGRPNAPRVIILHGLEGGSHSTYARGLLHEAHRERAMAAS
jgi:predicted alpha/beta-fold hydrolase